MKVDWPHKFVVGGLVMLACVVAQVFFAWVPINDKILLVDLVAGVEVSHLKHPRALPPDSTVNNAH